MEFTDENLSREDRKLIEERIKLWNGGENSLAPLTEEEDAFLNELECSLQPKSTDLEEEADEESINFKEFNDWFSEVELDFKSNDEKISEFYKFISACEDQATHMARLSKSAATEARTLKSEYERVLSVIKSFCDSCQKILDEQNALLDRFNCIESRLSHFTDADLLNRKLNSNLIASNVELIIPILTRIDECLIYLTAHPEFRESEEYKRKIYLVLDKALEIVKTKICDYILLASLNVQKPQPNIQSEEAFTVLYGKYRTHASKVKSLTDELSLRAVRIPQYEEVLQRCQQHYFDRREAILSPSVLAAFADLERVNQRDMCTLTRSGCAFMIRLCDDEYELFVEFFGQGSVLLNNFLNNYCTKFYDMLRPKIIHVQHIETLAELISIFKAVILDSRSQGLDAFENMCLRILEDAQERLVYRINIYMKEQILGYKPVSGDIAYPERLHLMRGISLSLEKQRRPNADSKSNFLPPDLHGMWYPTLRRTLVCLSKSFRCLDNAIFQGLSQEMIVDCIHSLKLASELISKRSSSRDGCLFLIKHLLMLREQIFPFNVDFAIRETSLDFSKLKDAAIEFLRKSTKVLSIRENSFLEFLLQGTLDVRDNFIDSKREVDYELKLNCEKFIDETYKHLVKDLISFIQEANDWIEKEMKTSDKTNFSLCSFKQPCELNEMVIKNYCMLKESIPFLQESLSLYLLSKDTEEILFKLIKGKIITVFHDFIQLLEKYYATDELQVIKCPTLDQIDGLLSTGSELLTD